VPVNKLEKFKLEKNSMSVLSTFIVNSELSVVCFRRDNCRNGPFFAVREFDIKVIRARDKGRRGRGPSEQAIRASIRQAVLNMNLKSERASKAEIRQLKGHGILGKRAPSCSLLCAEDMCRLLEAFGKDECVRDLRVALLNDRKAEDSETKLVKNQNISFEKTGSNKRKSLSLTNKFDRVENHLAPKRAKIDIPKPETDESKQLQPSFEPQEAFNDTNVYDTNGLDALYSALLAFADLPILDPSPSIPSLPPLPTSFSFSYPTVLRKKQNQLCQKHFMDG